MTWVELFPAACCLLYLGAAGGYFWRGDYPLAFMYLCYAGANVGLVFAGARSA